MNKKHYVVKFIDTNGKEVVFNFLTEDVTKAISEYSRTHDVVLYEILDENTITGKHLLLG